MTTLPSSIGGFVIGQSAIQGTPLTNEPVTQQVTIPSYLYQQYQDDSSLAAFVRAYNVLTQLYLDWLNAVNLPNYTASPAGLVAGPLLDWVGEGLYGTPRPIFPSGTVRLRGALNTYAFNTLALNTARRVANGQFYQTDDDIYRRVITWNFYKGDGHVFNIRWLKRRIMRFILGADGVDFNVDTTYRISVFFGADNDVTVLILNGLRTVTGGAIPNRFAPNTFAPNQLRTTFTPLTEPFFDEKYLIALQQGLASGVLQTPFQYNFNLVIGSYNGVVTGGFAFGISAFGEGGF